MELLKKMTVEELLKIFYSNNPLSIEYESLEEISFMLEEGFITFETLILGSHDDFLQRIDYVTDPHNGYIRSGESYSHLALKSFARGFLLMNNVMDGDVLYEQALDGFKVDVIDREFHFPVECGDTNASKLESYLAFSSVRFFTVIPYPRTKAFKFLANKHFFEYVDFKRGYLSKKRIRFR